MHLWSVKRLAEGFKAESVTERQQLFYLLLFTFLTDVASDPYITSMSGSLAIDETDAVLCIGSLVIGVLGTIACYQASRSNPDNRGFIARFFCLSVPVLFQASVAFFVLAVLTLVLANLFVSESAIDAYFASNGLTWADVAAIETFGVGYFAYLQKAIRWSYA